MHLAPNMYKIVTVQANAQEIITLKCIWCQICTNLLLWRQMLRKSLRENVFDVKYVQIRYFTGKCSGNHHVKMHLTPHMYKIITVKANAKEIVTVKCVWCQICKKSLLWRQMLRKSLLENVFDAKYVQIRYFTGKCSGNHHVKMYLTPHMYKIITLKTHAKKIVTVKCMWHHICTKPLLWRQMLRISLL